MKEQVILWHYTTKKKLDLIIKSGCLRVSEWEKQQGDKHPSLWFSTNQLWEETATKLIKQNGMVTPLTKEQQHAIEGLGRIGINYSPDLITWGKYRHKSGLPAEVLDGMELVAIRKGSAPKNWYASLVDIKKSLWVAVEIWDGQSWLPY